MKALTSAKYNGQTPEEAFQSKGPHRWTLIALSPVSIFHEALAAECAGRHATAGALESDMMCIIQRLPVSCQAVSAVRDSGQ
jgi:hypothetical protein